jgi:hypothetical protein
MLDLPPLGHHLLFRGTSLFITPINRHEFQPRIFDPYNLSRAKTATTAVTASTTASGIRKPPLPKTRAKIVEPVTTLRTGLTEDQLRNMTSTIRERSPSPSYSETQTKRRKIDNLLERGSEFLSSSDTGRDAMMRMMIMQTSERDARADEWRREAELFSE